MPQDRKTILTVLATAAVIIGAVVFKYYPIMGKNPVESKNITWGIDFSQMQAESLGLDWKKAYSAIISDLGAKNIKLHTQWDWVEGDKNGFYFNDIDWQIKEAEKNGVKIIFVLGIKTGRWPECHIPAWAQKLDRQNQQAEVLKYATAVVARYKSSKAIAFWQVENEPFFKFGECPSWYYKDSQFLETEIRLVKALDPSRQIIISDSGEQSNWKRAAEHADIVGVTMYRGTWNVVSKTFGKGDYSFLNPNVYYNKAYIIKEKFNKKVICVELQAEPWASKPIPDSSMEEQMQSMNPEMFKQNIEFAKNTGLDTFYFWGAEWWYWLKEKQSKPEIWNEAKKLLAQ